MSPLAATRRVNGLPIGDDQEWTVGSLSQVELLHRLLANVRASVRTYEARYHHLEASQYADHMRDCGTAGERAVGADGFSAGHHRDEEGGWQGGKRNEKEREESIEVDPDCSHGTPWYAISAAPRHQIFLSTPVCLQIGTVHVQRNLHRRRPYTQL